MCSGRRGDSPAESVFHLMREGAVAGDAARPAVDNGNLMGYGRRNLVVLGRPRQMDGNLTKRMRSRSIEHNLISCNLSGNVGADSRSRICIRPFQMRAILRERHDCGRVRSGQKTERAAKIGRTAGLHGYLGLPVSRNIDSRWCLIIAASCKEGEKTNNKNQVDQTIL